MSTLIEHEGKSVLDFYWPERSIMKHMNRVMFGSLETVAMPDLHIDEVIAKVDTGAWSGALHCTDIYEENGTLFFTPLGDTQFTTSTQEFDLRQVRSASGHVSERYIIPMALVIRGKKYHTSLGLTDRSEMQREVLLGRKFLIENKILVDVLLTLEDDHEAEKYL